MEFILPRIWTYLFYATFLFSLFWQFFIFRFNAKVKKIKPDYKMLQVLADPSNYFKILQEVFIGIFTLKLLNKNFRNEFLDKGLNLKEIKTLNNSELNKEIRKLSLLITIYFTLFLTLLFFLPILMIIHTILWILFIIISGFF